MKNTKQMAGMKGVPYVVKKKPGQSRMNLSLGAMQGVGYNPGRGDQTTQPPMPGKPQSNIKK